MGGLPRSVPPSPAVFSFARTLILYRRLRRRRLGRSGRAARRWADPLPRSPSLPPRGCSRGVKSGDDGMRMSPEGKREGGRAVSGLETEVMSRRILSHELQCEIGIVEKQTS